MKRAISVIMCGLLLAGAVLVLHVRRTSLSPRGFLGWKDPYFISSIGDAWGLYVDEGGVILSHSACPDCGGQPFRHAVGCKNDRSNDPNAQLYQLDSSLRVGDVIFIASGSPQLGYKSIQVGASLRTVSALLFAWVVSEVLRMGFAKRLTRHRARAGLCLGCGYDLRGSESGTCSECGLQGARSLHSLTEPPALQARVIGSRVARTVLVVLCAACAGGVWWMLVRGTYATPAYPALYALAAGTGVALLLLLKR